MTRAHPRTDAATGVSRLEIDFEEDDQKAPGVRFRIDGVDLRSQPALVDREAADPPTVIGPKSSVMTRHHPHRALIYLCSCTIAGCSDVGPIIERLPGGLVRWSDFRAVTGHEDWYELVPRKGGRVLAVSEIHFDAQQYRDEIYRAIVELDRRFPHYETARVVESALAVLRSRMANAGFAPKWVASWRPDVWSIALSSLREGDDTLIELPSLTGSPQEIAAHIVERLSSMPVREWPRADGWV